MSALFLLFGLVINSSFKVVFSVLPDCHDETAVENFVRSPSYLSLYTLSANLTKQTLNATQKALENNDLSLKKEDILPQNISTYLRRRPPMFCNHSANAVFHLTLLSLDSIDETDMTFTLDFWLTIAWYDTRLHFPRNSVRDVRLLDIKWLDDIWKPDVIIRNARELDVLDQIVANQALKMLRDQVVVLISKITTTLTCPMKFENYPHDVQDCDMKMESMSHTVDDLTFSWDSESPISIHQKNKREALKTPQFEIPIADIKTEECPDLKYYSGSYPCLLIKFRLKRSLGYHMIHTYIPSGSVVFLSWITFWMKAEALAARFALGVTALLTLVTLSSQSQKDLPPESSAKAVDVWMMSCGLFVFGSILEFAIVNYLVCRFAENAGENVIKSQETGQFFQRVRAVFSNEKIHMICHNMDRVSRAFFPLCFVILNLWYWNRYVLSEESTPLWTVAYNVSRYSCKNCCKFEDVVHTSG